MKRYHLTAVIWQEGRQFIAKCPELGVASFGATLEKARAALEEAVALHLSNAKKLGTLSDIEPSVSSRTRYAAALDIVRA